MFVQAPVKSVHVEAEVKWPKAVGGFVSNYLIEAIFR